MNEGTRKPPYPGAMLSHVTAEGEAVWVAPRPSQRDLDEDRAKQQYEEEKYIARIAPGLSKPESKE